MKNYYTHVRFCILFSLITLNIASQTFTWINGSDTLNQFGVYGTQGVSSPTNKPGSRWGSVTWTDNNGNLWLFGGSGYNSTVAGYLNDLWKYNIVTNEWTWMKGTTTNPTPNGVYGTMGVSAPGNSPGGRYFSAGWTDMSGNLWLFGGFGFSAGPGGYMDDLWKYDITTNEWTWVKGNTIGNQPGVYGTKGVSAPTNLPRSRYYHRTWADASGNLWLFGGAGHLNVFEYYNDVWKYSIATNEWTWMHGNNFPDAPAAYGTLGVPAATNTPGARISGGTWKDNSGNLFLFGGRGMGTTQTGYLNDMWHYNISTNTWTWIKGSNAVNTLGTYGTKGVVSALNTPGGRCECASWKDQAGNFWLFGGEGNTDVQNPGMLNDLWRYSLSSNDWVHVKGTAAINQNGIYGTMGVPDTSNLPGARRLIPYWTDNNGNGWMFGGLGYPASGPDNHLTDLWKFDNCFVSAVTSPAMICTGQSATITASGAYTYTWNGTPGTSPITISPPASTIYTLTATGQNNCISTTFVNVNVSLCVGISESVKNPGNFEFQIHPVPASDYIKINCNQLLFKLEIIDLNGKLQLYQEVTDPAAVFDITVLKPGMYFVKATSANGVVTKKLIKQ